MEQDTKIFCVYMHVCKLNNKVYVGITNQAPEKRWGKNGSRYLEKNKNGVYSHPAFAHALLKYSDWDNDWRHIIFDTNLSEEKAKHVEKLLIALYKTNCCKYNNPSYGYNLTDGGEGCTGRIVSVETKKKLREQRIGEKNPMYGVRLTGEKNGMYGKKHSEELKQKMKIRFSGKNNPNYGKPMPDEQKIKISESRKGKYAGENAPMYGKHHSEETKKKLSESHKGLLTGEKHPQCKSVYCPELNQIFWGAKEVELKYGIRDSDVTACIRGRQKSAGKHPITNEKLHWMYAEEYYKQLNTTQND